MGRSADVPRQSGQIDGDDAGCTILHVDMDAFFASVEIRQRPELAGLPVVVGGAEGRGVVAAASYPARKFGIRSAMSMAQALRLCPRLVVITPERGSYVAVSREIMAILNDFTPMVEPLSVDEAFLDVSGAIGMFGRPAEIARQIRHCIWTEQRLTCSVGVASIKAVAKLASSSCKPDGLRVVSVAGLLDFLHPLPVTALSGVGRSTAQPLQRLGIRTVGDLAATPLDTLRRAVGDRAARQLSELAAGRDSRSVAARGVEKSISTDRTMMRDLLTEGEVTAQLHRSSIEIAERLHSADLKARTIGIKIRFADFTTVTRVHTIAEATDSAMVVFRESVTLYRALNLDKPRVRLVGVKVENLTSAHDAVQLCLDLDAAATPTKRIMARPDAAMDAVRARFGGSAVGSASLLGAPEPRDIGGISRSTRAQPMAMPAECDE